MRMIRFPSEADMIPRLPALLTSTLLLLAAPLLSAQDPPPPRAVPLDLADKEGNYAPLPPKTDLDANLRIQIYLDENNFGPGYLDGKIGEFGKKRPRFTIRSMESRSETTIP
jgi:hypothetical protein